MDEKEIAKWERDMEDPSYLESLKPAGKAKAVSRTVYSLRLTVEEHNMIESAARERGLSMSDFIRLAVMQTIKGQRPSIADLRSRTRELADLVNQL